MVHQSFDDEVFKFLKIDPLIVFGKLRHIFANIKRKTAILYDAYDPHNRTSQSERIFGPGWNFSHRKKGKQRIEFIAHRNDGREIGRRERALFSGRQILLFERETKRFRLSGGFGVVVSHQSLQFGKFVDHIGQQIGFGKHNASLKQRFRFRKPVFLMKHRGDLRLSETLVPDTSEPLHEGDLFEPFVVESAFKIVFVKKECVAESGAQYFFVSGNNL